MHIRASFRSWKRVWGLFSHSNCRRSFSKKPDICANNLHTSLCLRILVTALGTGLISFVAAKYSTVFLVSANSNREETNRGKPKRCFHTAIEKSKRMISAKKIVDGCPGIVIGISVDGEDVWSKGFGYADLENHVPCTPETVLRLASISKPITMAAVAKLWEMGQLDLDKPVQTYVPGFPEKTVNGEKVELTTRHLISHLGGIRSYQTKEKNKNNNSPRNVAGNSSNAKNPKSGKELNVNETKDERSDVKKEEILSDWDFPEFFSMTNYKTTNDALQIFMNDPLLKKPGDKYNYSTFGWTLVGAVLEGASGQKLPDILRRLFKDLGLEHTYLEEATPLIYKRGRQYVKDKKGYVVNAPYVDNSSKWAGGGILADTGDLLRFGNVMLYSYQYGMMAQDKNTNKENLKPNRSLEDSNKNVAKQNICVNDGMSLTRSQESRSCCLPGYLKADTMAMIWTPVKNTSFKDGNYAMGWGVVDDLQQYGFARHRRGYVAHTGGAVGGSTVLLILPRLKDSHDSQQRSEDWKACHPKGVVVAIMANSMKVGLSAMALQIAKLFETESKPCRKCDD